MEQNAEKKIIDIAPQSPGSATIKMVENALRVVDTLRESGTRLGVNEIAKLCRLSPSTTFRILKTLEAAGWAFQFSDNQYILGEKFEFATEKNNLYLALSDVASFIMNAYSEKYNSAMNLMVRIGDHCRIIQQSRSKKLIDYVPPLGTEPPIYACACGKVLMSELPVNLVEMIIESNELKPLTKNTITDSDQLWKAIRQAGRCGYAIENKESSESGSCIAVPVRDNQNTIIAALSFSGFIGIEDPYKKLPEYLPALQEASKKISKALYTCWR